MCPCSDCVIDTDTTTQRLIVLSTTRFKRRISIQYITKMTRLTSALLLVAAALSPTSAFVPSSQLTSVPIAKSASKEEASSCPNLLFPIQSKDASSTTSLAMRWDDGYYGYGGGYGYGRGSYGYGGGYGGGYGYGPLSPRQQMRMRERDDYYGGGYGGGGGYYGRNYYGGGGGGYYGRGYGTRGSNGGYYGDDYYRGTTGNGMMNRMDYNSPYSRNMMVPRYGGGYNGDRYGRYGGGGYYDRGYPRDRMSRRDIYDGYNSYYGNGRYGGNYNGYGGRRRMYGGVWNQDNDFIDPQPYRRGYGGGYGDYGGHYRRNNRSLMASGTMNMNGETHGDRVQRYNREARQYGSNLYAWD